MTIEFCEMDINAVYGRSFQELENLVNAHEVTSHRMNSSDQSQLSIVNPMTQDQGAISLLEIGRFAGVGSVKQEEELDHYQPTYMSFTYMDAAGQADLSNVVLSEEELTEILNEMSPLDQMVSAMPDPLAAYFDMSLADVGSMTITQLL
jgi:hypothetical protein